jgi:DNA-binding transcriptional MocR family regulator
MAEFVRAEGVPIYVQIRESLRGEITRGVLTRGEQLPSENELAAKYSVSRMTIRESSEDLVDEGLLYRRHGVGTFVAYPHLDVRGLAGSYSCNNLPERESLDYGAMAGGGVDFAIGGRTFTLSARYDWGVKDAFSNNDAKNRALSVLLGIRLR